MKPKIIFILFLFFIIGTDFIPSGREDILRVWISIMIQVTPLPIQIPTSVAMAS